MNASVSWVSAEIIRPAMSTSAKIWELENARLRLLGSAAYTKLLAHVFAVLFRGLQVPAAHQPVLELFNLFSLKASKISTKPGIDVIRETIRRQKHAGREVWRLGPLEHPDTLPRSSLRPAWWKWRKVYGSAWIHPGEHINVLELRAVINGVLWRVRSASNMHSKGVFAMDSMVILGALAKGRSASRRLAPLVMKFNSLVVAAFSSPLLVWCRTDLNRADEPSRHG